MPQKPSKKFGKGKGQPEVVQESKLTSVEKQFYLSEISDLNERLANLRSHNAKIENEIIQIESRAKKLEEDREDVTLYLNRTLHEKLNEIRELEERLNEVSKIRCEENANFQMKIDEWVEKYENLQDKFSMEVNLLEAKLRTLEVFRVERVNLMEKFEAQQQEMKDLEMRQKANVKEMELKLILDKDKIRKDVENKLLELSTEFTKRNELRIAGSTQRLIRENIAINNEMDQMMFTLDRMQNERDEMKKKQKEMSMELAITKAERNRLIKTSQERFQIIENLTIEYEKLRDLNKIREAHDNARYKTQNYPTDLDVLKKKIQTLQRQIHVKSYKIEQLKSQTHQQQNEIARITKLIELLNLHVKSAIRSDIDDDDFEFREAQRKNLLYKLTEIFNEYENGEVQEISIATIPSISNHSSGDLQTDVDVYDEIAEKFSNLHLDPKIIKTPSVISMEEILEEQTIENPMHDVESGSFEFSVYSNDGDDELKTDDDDDHRVVNLQEK